MNFNFGDVELSPAVVHIDFRSFANLNFLREPMGNRYNQVVSVDFADSTCGNLKPFSSGIEWNAHNELAIFPLNRASQRDVVHFVHRRSLNH